MDRVVVKVGVWRTSMDKILPRAAGLSSGSRVVFVMGFRAEVSRWRVPSKMTVPSPRNTRGAIFVPCHVTVPQPVDEFRAYVPADLSQG